MANHRITSGSWIHRPPRLSPVPSPNRDNLPLPGIYSPPCKAPDGGGRRDAIAWGCLGALDRDFLGALGRDFLGALGQHVLFRPLTLTLTARLPILYNPHKPTASDTEPLGRDDVALYVVHPSSPCCVDGGHNAATVLSWVKSILYRFSSDILILLTLKKGICRVCLRIL